MYFHLKGMGIDVKLPIVVRCDIIGAIFMAENSSSGIRTCHIETRYHFVCEHVEERLIKIVFVESNINDTDMWERKHMKKC
jgi:hypothetical protein